MFRTATRGILKSVSHRPARFPALVASQAQIRRMIFHRRWLFMLFLLVLGTGQTFAVARGSRLTLLPLRFRDEFWGLRKPGFSRVPPEIS